MGKKKTTPPTLIVSTRDPQDWCRDHLGNWLEKLEIQVADDGQAVTVSVLVGQEGAEVGAGGAAWLTMHADGLVEMHTTSRRQ